MKITSSGLGKALFGAAVGALALGPGLAQAQQVNALTPNEKTCSTAYGVIVAEALGFHEEMGITGNLLASATTVPYVAFLSTGDADIVMLDSAQVYQMANAGEENSVIYEVMQFAPEGIVVPADSPISGLADLKGTTIGLASDRDQITTIVALRSVGLSIDEVETAVVGDSGPVMAGALRDGTIDAFAGGSSDRRGIEANGVEIRNITPPEVSDNPGNSYVIADARKEELRPQVEKFLRGWAMSQMASVMDTKAIESICKNALPEEWEVMEFGHALMQGSIYELNLRRAKLFGELRPWVWAKVGQTYLELGEIEAAIDPSEFLDPSFIGPANDWESAEVAEAIAEWKEANPDLLIQ